MVPPSFEQNESETCSLYEQEWHPKQWVKFPFAWTDSSKPSPTNVFPLMITVSSADARKERAPISVYGELKNITIGFRAITFKHCRLNDEEHNGEGV